MSLTNENSVYQSRVWSHLWLVLAPLAAVVAAFFTLAGSAQATPNVAVARLSPARATATACTTPTTAAGFQAMFDALPTWQWGGADGSLSVDMGDGRTVWLYGDTLDASPPSGGPGRFVHSSAIVQRGGCLHVSHLGAQLLPDDPDGAFYWIDSATRMSPSELRVRAAGVEKTGPGPWDWKATGEFKTARVHLYPNGNLRFQAWVGHDYGQPTPPSQLLDYQCALWVGYYRLPDSPDLCADGGDKPGEFHYQPRTHPEQRLAGGLTLVTVSYNNDQALTGDWQDYRPRFFAVSL